MGAAKMTTPLEDELETLEREQPQIFEDPPEKEAESPWDWEWGGEG